jgi:hypothetical protein
MPYKINGDYPSWERLMKPTVNLINDLFGCPCPWNSLRVIGHVPSQLFRFCREVEFPNVSQFVSVVRSMARVPRQESHFPYIRFANTYPLPAGVRMYTCMCPCVYTNASVVAPRYLPNARVATVEVLWQGNAITFDYW